MSNFSIDAIGRIVGDANVDAPGSDALRQIVTRHGNIAGARANIVALARPGNGDELAALVKQARQDGLALLTLYNASSVGASLGGDGDCLVLDLSRMNRILEVNLDYAFARVEAGASFADLASHLAKHDLPLMVDAERDPNASIAGSVFSKGMGFTPYADHALVQCGGEFVLPDGALVGTGMGAMPESRTWNVYKFALGPFSDGLAIQSGGMIPTQIGIWLMGKPPAIQPFAFDLKDDDALAAAIEFLRPLKLSNTLAGTIAITHNPFDAARGSIAADRGEWRLFGAHYGLPATVALIASMVDGGLGQIAGCRKLDPAALGNDPAWREQIALMSGAPGPGAPHFGSRNGSAAARMTFVAPIEGDAAISMMKTASAALDVHKLPLLVELSLCGRSLFQALYLPYEPGPVAGISTVAACASQLITDMGKAGFGLVSETLELSRLAASTLGSSPLGQLQARVHEAIK
ncbi:FAD-dependent oxidoreductase [Novosphingobium sp. CCH12-A3]|uniref:FAD-binding oxidoreductase n=1 Tax=Novosphingobium sp. CCH12-A3 TaxID=1768752 RepID=UPI0007858D56|nr:FAD-dependent oxidoreductase [Novosphingobium sp. CCH12-A3]